MKRLTSAIVMMTFVVSGVALRGQQRDAQDMREYWSIYASKLPIGATVTVRTSDGKRQTAVLAVVNSEGIMLQPKGRIPEPPRRVSFDRLEQLELKKNGAGLAKAVAIGAGVGAGTFVGLLLLLAASWD